jgi:hypothetical protein
VNQTAITPHHTTLVGYNIQSYAVLFSVLVVDCVEENSHGLTNDTKRNPKDKEAHQIL